MSASCGQVVGERLDGQQAGQVLRQQAEHLRLVLLAQHVHLRARCRPRRLRAWLRSVRRERRPVGRGVEHAVVEQLVEQQRMARDVICAAQLEAPTMRATRSSAIGMLGEQREVGARGGDRLDEIEAAGERGVGIRRVGRDRGQRGHQGVEAAARIGRQQRVALAARGSTVSRDAAAAASR